MTPNNRQATTPQAILEEEFIKPKGLTLDYVVDLMSAALGETPASVRASLSAEFLMPRSHAEWLAEYTGTTRDFWDNLSANAWVTRPREFSREALGDRIRAARNAQGLKVRELGNLCDQPEQVIYRWETGKAAPHLANFVDLCVALKVSPNDLLGWPDKEGK